MGEASPPGKSPVSAMSGAFGLGIAVGSQNSQHFTVGTCSKL